MSKKLSFKQEVINELPYYLLSKLIKDKMFCTYLCESHNYYNNLLLRSLDAAELYVRSKAYKKPIMAFTWHDTVHCKYWLALYHELYKSVKL